MRINKYIAQAGIASRRKADELIADGKVKINGAVLREPGYDVAETDVVEVLGQTLVGREDYVYYALNKPAGYVTTMSDEKGRPTVASLMTDVTARVFPVGRLDYDSSGLIIMTNDGALSQQISHPKHAVVKTYIATVNGCLSRDQLWALRNGVEIEIKQGNRLVMYKTKPAFIEAIKTGPNQSVYEVKISEGKNRQIRKMFQTQGLKVLELTRTAIGEIKLGRTHEGGYRKLTKNEIEYLKNLSCG